ncbi:glycoside hydrolase [Aspergillus campestris IBT 28561]|uniref:chitinase n=1 Tax=Aspergillus campestris (strain IBT 28561) TaxID=1392248 RepID=A0A2I1CT05_ASPC2|nr:glycoside hydrolase [Aspergillus campestris IBT 28561]PKY00745.1 glycoside hydrolase [Aspergillus campestris IBT 28561]
MTPAWLSTAAWALGLLLYVEGGSAIGTPDLRKPASPGYRGSDPCPTSCRITGPNPSNWSAYHNFEQLQSCKQSLFYEFSLYDKVDDPETLHRIYACASNGEDWYNLPQSQKKVKTTVESVDSTYQIGWWADGALSATGISAVLEQMRRYLKVDHAASKNSTFLFARLGSASVGVYIGKGLQKESVSSFALRTAEHNIAKLPVNTGTVAMQLCDQNKDSGFTFGLIASSNGTFASVQDAMKTWAKGGCLSFHDSKNITGTAALTTPLFSSTKATKSKLVSSSISSLGAKQSATLPDLAPKPGADGSCATYTVQPDDNCSNLAAAYSLTIAELEEFNKNTWGWNGCSNVWKGTVMCLSTGTPPMPAPLENAVCGPQMPGTPIPSDTTNLTHLNPCPLNACCNVWGQCGITDEFCIDTSTGAPGSSEQGTAGCISNCGTQLVRSDAPEVFRSIAYYQGYSFNGRQCLYQDALQIDGSKYTHLHFAFATLTDDYEVVFEDKIMEYEFSNFLKIAGPKKILSFGGWGFSTNPDTYHIFRQGVKPANRLKFATNVANFIEDRGVDGVDIDWEYPGAPDMPGIPLPTKTTARTISPFSLSSKICSGGSRFQSQRRLRMCLRSHVNLTETMSSMVMITKAGVPSNKVVIGMTSYARSFAMADPECYGPECFFTGAPTDSPATKGVCTATGGYIADAEINEIISNSSRVNQQYTDSTSHSSILVYDNDQWAAYMSPAIKAARKTLYKNLNMGGSSDWATDLQEYNDPPNNGTTWADFKEMVNNGEDPWEVEN